MMARGFLSIDEVLTEVDDEGNSSERDFSFSVDSETDWESDEGKKHCLKRIWKVVHLDNERDDMVKLILGNPGRLVIAVF